MFTSLLSLKNLSTGLLLMWVSNHACPPVLVMASFRAYCNTDRAEERNALSSNRKHVGSSTAPVIPARKCLASSNLFCSCMAQPHHRLDGQGNRPCQAPHHGQADSPEIRLTTALAARIYFANSITQARSSGCFRCVALPAKLDLYSTVHFGEHNKTPARNLPTRASSRR